MPHQCGFPFLIQNTDADQVLLAQQRDDVEHVKLAHTLADLTRFPRGIRGYGGYFVKQPGVNDSICSQTAVLCLQDTA